MLVLIFLRTYIIIIIIMLVRADFSMDQMEKILVLLLGCVVQCDNKVPLIEQMKKMDLNQQGALVMYIKQVTDSTDYVCSIDWNDLQDISKQ